MEGASSAARWSASSPGSIQGCWLAPSAHAKEDAAAKKGDDAKKDDAAAKKDEVVAKTPPADDKETEKIMAMRKIIEAENQKRHAEYEAQVKKGQETVKDLNLRFGDWYFVVNDDVFRKIRLSKDKVVKKKEKKAEDEAEDGHGHSHGGHGHSH